jgi:hypothetical protein
MELVYALGAAAGLIAVVVGIYSILRLASKLQGLWRSAAEQAGLEGLRMWTSGGIPVEMTGRLGGLPLCVHRRLVQDGPMTVVELTQPALSRVRVGPACTLDLSVTGWATGDDNFDQSVDIGIEGQPFPILDAPTRARLASFVDLGGKVELATVVLEHLGDMTSAPELVALIRQVESVSRLFDLTLDPTEELARLAREDPDAGVRRLALERLVGHFPNHPATAAGLRLALADAAPGPRFAAARVLPEGEEVLHALATGQHGDDVVCAEAIAVLGSRLQVAELISIVNRALVSSWLPVLQMAAEHLARAGGVAAERRLKQLTVSATPDIVLAGLQGLVVLGGRAVTERCLALLTREEGELRLKALEILAKNAGIELIGAIREAASRHPLEHDRREVAATIAAIQARSGGEAGRVSLTDAQAGALTLPEEMSGGEVSLAPPRKAQKESP